MTKSARWNVAEQGPRPVDAHVGRRIRLRRKLLGISQEKLGAAIGLTFQQVQKYELGTNRISASRLYELSKVFDVPVSYFFDDMPAEVEGDWTGRPAGMAEAALETDVLAKQETLSFVRSYYRIKNATVRRRLYELTKTLANQLDA